MKLLNYEKIFLTHPLYQKILLKRMFEKYVCGKNPPPLNPLPRGEGGLNLLPLDGGAGTHPKGRVQVGVCFKINWINM